VLDAPELADDFYLNLVDWGSTNILGVGLGSCVYMWNSASGKVTKLCDLGTDDTVTSVSWIQRVLPITRTQALRCITNSN
jgi:cell division cycle 20-like protein 1 (cofactor of APC complex)